MPRTTSTSNPTNLVEIERQHVTIDVVESDGMRWAYLTRLDITPYKLDPSLKLVLIALAGSTFLRFELGNLSVWNKSPQFLDGLDTSATLRFRLLIHPEGNPCLSAAAENLIARNFEDADSFFAMQPADLGDVAWEFSWVNEEPTLLFNQSLFPNARGAIAYAPFTAFVLPEVVRQVAARLAASPERLKDEDDALHLWSGFLERLGLDDPPEEYDPDGSEKWVRGVVGAFSTHHRIIAELRRSLAPNAD